MTAGFARDRSGYLPLAGYGLIGDCRSAALVGVDGSIDWLCLPRFDDHSVFGRVLDSRRGGYWQIGPERPGRSQQRYRDRSNVLDTLHHTGSGVVLVTDFMPVDEHNLQEHARLHNSPRVVRIVECLAGEVTMRQVFQPALHFTDAAECSVHRRHIHAELGRLHLRVASTCDIDSTSDTFTLRMGDMVAFGMRSGKPGARGAMRWSVERAHALLRETLEYWWRWVAQIRYSGPYSQHVWRSALCLKLMTYSPTGAIVAAPTTSLPESIGGPRNWDYRYTWLRDASFTLYAFFQLDLTQEAEAFFRWLCRVRVGRARHGMPNLYDLSGRSTIQEVELAGVDGYRHSRPVRLGNGAVDQLQLDVYGEVLDSAYLYARFGGDISRTLWMRLRDIVELAIERWTEPDSSIWEVRSERLHYTYSKLMCWVAVDRGLRIAERYGHPHDAPRWRSTRTAMRRRIMAESYSPKQKAFTQAWGSAALDSAVLRISQVRFLPDRDPRIVSTIRAIERRLGEGVLVRRYNTDESRDGVDGTEGAFFMTSFWMADALAHAGDLEGAQRRFERLLGFGSPLGLFSEEVDPRTGDLLGNFPQAFTHLALVGAAVNIERARNRRLSVQGLRQPTA